MFKKLFLNVLKRLKPDELQAAREILEGNADERISDKKRDKRKDKKEQIVMENEPEKKPETETKAPVEPKQEEQKPVEPAKEEPKTEEPAKAAPQTEQTQPALENSTENPDESAGQVQEETSATQAGVRVEDLVTKEMLADKFAALEAKLDAVLKENQSLKDKYENKDFGGMQKQGVPQKDNDANDSFEEYSKQFM